MPLTEEPLLYEREPFEDVLAEVDELGGNDLLNVVDEVDTDGLAEDPCDLETVVVLPDVTLRVDDLSIDLVPIEVLAVELPEGTRAPSVLPLP